MRMSSLDSPPISPHIVQTSTELRAMASRLMALADTLEASEVGRSVGQGDSKDGRGLDQPPPHLGYVDVEAHAAIGAPFSPPISLVFTPDAWRLKKERVIKILALFWGQFGEPTPWGSVKKWLGQGSWEALGLWETMLAELEAESRVVVRMASKRTMVVFRWEDWVALGSGGHARWDERATKVTRDMDLEVSRTPGKLGARLKHLRNRRKLDAARKARRLRFADGRRKADLAGGYFEAGGLAEKKIAEEIELSRGKVIRHVEARVQLAEVYLDGQKASDWVRGVEEGRAGGDSVSGGQGCSEGGDSAPLVEEGSGGGGAQISREPTTEGEG